LPASIALMEEGDGPGAGRHWTASAQAMGAKIHEMRKTAGFSQMALGARAGMHHNYVGILERGEVANPGLGTLTRIATGLHVSITILARAFVEAPAPGAQSTVPRERMVVAPGGPKALGQGLALLRTTAGHTQLGLALSADMQRQYLTGLEAGSKRNPGLRTITRLVEALPVSSKATSGLVARLAQLFAGEIGVEQFRAALPPRLPDAPGPHPSPKGRSAH
jgi:transcriptional regulator with XRE-family HTH domain